MEYKGRGYTVEDGGRLNNFAVEPKMYKAEPPTKNQQRTYVVLGVIGAGLVGMLVFVAASVS
ncbi:MAG: ssl1498 family light-harvesting-like protein [Leptolyngbyaceae cyanobacterium RU_5_1]|nr:ssl1498 family light-harvesting-like protein [Leptolyngbyaceae cyanobacterium RU_5_1]